ncbi:MAG: sigma-70 family RNA polymerase sigma factor [Nannocystaceae bacterium]|nr:sigma-70 family RNA polymerase sigma factor [Nannocystaceae bacterium]
MAHPKPSCAPRDTGRTIDDGAQPDRRALRSIYDAHVHFVRRNAIRLGIPTAHADDVVQEVFVTLVRRWGAVGAVQSVRALLFAVTRRVSANYRRKLERNAVDPLPSPALLTVDDDGFDRVDAAHTVARFLAQLDEPRRLVFVLAELEGMSAPEIADALGGLNLNTVYTRLRWARRRFKTLIAAQEARQ